MIIQTNLLPEELRKKERLKLSLPEVPVNQALTIFFGAFFVIQASLSAFAFYQKGNLGHVKARTLELKSQTRDVALHKAEIASHRARSNEIASLTARRYYWTQLLNTLSDSVTKGIWLTALAIEDGEAQGVVPGPRARKPEGPRFRALRLDGSAVGQGQETAYIGKFIKELKEHPFLSELFSDVKLQNINQKKVRETDVYDFTLTCLFKPEPKS